MSLHLGLTGGIGSGKTTVAAHLQTLGAALIDADAISRQSTASGGLAIEAIRCAFGAEFITPQGALDRARMAEHCFGQPAARRQLESIIHPIVQIQSLQQAIAHEQAGYPVIVWDIPLLVESGHWRARMHRILVVDCEPETQISRVVARSQSGPRAMQAQDVQRIIAAQASRARRLDCADWVIFNDGIGMPGLLARISFIHTQAMTLSKSVQSGLSSAL
jgi:dephospho-CoA kinase